MNERRRINKNILLDYGNTVAGEDWVLDEQNPTGYSRVYYVYSGDVLYADDYVKCEFRRGTLYMLPSNLPYSARRLSDEDFHCTYLHVSIEPMTLSKLIEIPVQPDTMLSQLMGTIMSAIDENEIEILSGLCDCLIDYLDRMGGFCRPSADMELVIEYIERHIDEDLTLQMLSEQLAYHPNYFIRRFKQEMGMTPHQYIIRARMQMARGMILEGQPLGAVAQKVGYKDTSNFTCAFRQMYGVSPKRYTREHGVP